MQVVGQVAGGRGEDNVENAEVVIPTISVYLSGEGQDPVTAREQM